MTAEANETSRPWGLFRVLRPNTGQDNFQVKQIVVNPGKRLSLQTHTHRCEHWIVTTGKGTALVGEDTLVLDQNSHIFVPTGVKHRISNTSDSLPLTIVEVQVGAIISEEDIERLEDDHGRA